MTGGLLEIPCRLIMEANDIDTCQQVCVVCPIVCYDAVIRVDMILSYEWLGQMNFDVSCRKHRLLLNRNEGPVWIPGVMHRKKYKPSQVQVLTHSKEIFMVKRSENANESYTVRWPYFHEIISRLKLEPTVDCFATNGNSRCKVFYTQSDDALKNIGEQETMWLNPLGEFGL